MTATTERSTNTDACPSWCQYDAPEERHAHVDSCSEVMELHLPPLFDQRDPDTDVSTLVPAVLGVGLSQDGSEPPTVSLDRNDQFIAQFTLDEADAFARWILRLVEAGRGPLAVPGSRLSDAQSTSARVAAIVAHKLTTEGLDVDQLAKLADVFGVDVLDLLDPEGVLATLNEV